MRVLRAMLLGVHMGVSGLAYAQSVQAQNEQDVSDLIYHYNAQVGMDAWQFSGERPDRLLMMATNTQWRYRPVSPWGTVDGRVMVLPQLTLALKARANQEMGGHVDELSADWAVSPKLGVKLGVLDYKTSWCRTYDIDSPWVRETDPFCNVVEVSGPTGGAPGAQVYANARLGAYRVQAIAGAYSPLLFNYNDKEFSNLTYPTSRVDKNNKQGFSINALNLDTATEFRFGVLSTQQEQAVHGNWNAEDFRVVQEYHITFVGLSYYLHPKLNMRVQTLQHVMANRNVTQIGSIYPRTIRGNQFDRQSYVMELTYQKNSQNMFAFAASVLRWHNAYTETNYPYSGYTVYPDFDDYKQSAISVAWRRDWGNGAFTAVQFTHSRMHDINNYYHWNNTASANGLGLRLGYRF